MVEPVQAALLEAQPAVPPLNLWSLSLKGGFLMIPVVLLSLITIYVFVERLMVLCAAARQDDTFMQRIKDYIHAGDIDSALNLCKKNTTLVARLVEKGITRLGRPMNDVLVAIENEGNIEVAKLERRFTWVATAAAGAPMLGFLGTVTGMVNAFYSMAAAGEAADITTLSSGIYEALVTTVAGLAVGIIALFAYNYLVSRVNTVVNQLETGTMEFMDLLNEPATTKK
ncbi:MAG: MotA/TolQ/ExbB proton channel family protein [Porphyromonadaceae bacterium]|nr:MotA/TolQ/ExbB proton channel family protein [Porphyromonadaceae bacterium]